MEWPQMLAQVQRWGFEYVFKRYYGLYEANVTDVRDPEKRGRIRALCPAIGAREPSREWFRRQPRLHTQRREKLFFIEKLIPYLREKCGGMLSAPENDTIHADSEFIK
jgi:hypothetical protein